LSADGDESSGGQIGLIFSRQPAGRRFIDHVLRVSQVKKRFNDSRAIDDYQPVAAGSMIVAEHVELDRRENTLERLAVEREISPLVRIAEASHADAAPLAANSGAPFERVVVHGALLRDDLSLRNLCRA